MQPEVYLDYFLNYSGSENLKDRFEVLKTGYEKTKDTVLCFFIASTFLEHGMLSEAEELLDTEDCRDYMLQRGITLLPQLYYEQKNYNKAEEEFESFYRKLYNDNGAFDKLLEEMSPQDLIMLALIKKDSGKNHLEIMKYAPKSSVHTDMSWQDLRSSFQEKLKNINPAEVGITGDPGEFNRRRKEYFQKRIQLIESYL